MENGTNNVVIVDDTIHEKPLENETNVNGNLEDNEKKMINDVETEKEVKNVGGDSPKKTPRKKRKRNELDDLISDLTSMTNAKKKKVSAGRKSFNSVIAGFTQKESEEREKLEKIEDEKEKRNQRKRKRFPGVYRLQHKEPPFPPHCIPLEDTILMFHRKTFEKKFLIPYLSKPKPPPKVEPENINDNNNDNNDNNETIATLSSKELEVLAAFDKVPRRVTRSQTASPSLKGSTSKSTRGRGGKRGRKGKSSLLS